VPTIRSNDRKTGRAIGSVIDSGQGITSASGKVDRVVLVIGVRAIDRIDQTSHIAVGKVEVAAIPLEVTTQGKDKELSRT